MAILIVAASFAALAAAVAAAWLLTGRADNLLRDLADNLFARYQSRRGLVEISQMLSTANPEQQD